MALRQNAESDADMHVSWPRALAAGAFLPGGGFVYSARPLAGVVAVLAFSFVRRLSLPASLALFFSFAVIAAGVAYREGSRDRPIEPRLAPGVVALLAVGLPVLATLVAGGGFRFLLCGYGQLGNRFVLRALAFFALSFWVAASGVTIVASIVLLLLSGAEACCFSWREASSEVVNYA